MRRRATQRRSRGRGAWVLVALCLGLAGLPAGPRQALRARLLDLHARLGRGLGAEPRPGPVARATGNRVRLLEAQVRDLQRRLEDAGVAREAVRLHPDAELIPAQAYPLARGADLVQRLVLDRGRKDGVRVGLPVLVGDALAGRVAEVSEASCEVHLVTDPTFRVRATIARSGGRDVEGLLMGDGTGLLVFQPAILDEAAPAPQPLPGETILCSRRSVLCGLPAILGVVEAIERRPGAPLPVARVLPACDLQRLSDLVIVRQATVEEAPTDS